MDHENRQARLKEHEEELRKRRVASDVRRVAQERQAQHEARQAAHPPVETHYALLPMYSQTGVR